MVIRPIPDKLTHTVCVLESIKTCLAVLTVINVGRLCDGPLCLECLICSGHSYTKTFIVEFRMVGIQSFGVESKLELACYHHVSLHVVMHFVLFTNGTVNLNVVMTLLCVIID